jgi:hypothetical protein
VPENADDVSIIIRKQDRGTVSSTIITLGEKADDCRYLYSPGPPDRADYIELSNSLRWLLGKRDAPPGVG